MRGGRVTGWSCAVLVAGTIVASCGESNSEGTLPPMITTTSTTVLPTTTTEPVQIIYVVQSGDGLQKIADAYQVSLTSLMELNGITDPDSIQVGQELKIPQGERVETQLPTTVAPVTP